MKTLSFNQVRLLRMNRASVCINIDHKYDTYFISRKHFNSLLAGNNIQYVIVDKEHQGVTLQWIAVPSIF
jgi:hypothetical protein